MVSLRVKLEAKCLSTPLRRSPFYPLNYGGVGVDSRDWVGLGGRRPKSMGLGPPQETQEPRFWLMAMAWAQALGLLAGLDD